MRSFDPIYKVWWYLAKWFPNYFGTGAQRNDANKKRTVRIRGTDFEVEVLKTESGYEAKWNQFSGIGNTIDEAISSLTDNLSFWLN